jgi:hypothetical protein
MACSQLEWSRSPSQSSQLPALVEYAPQIKVMEGQQYPGKMSHYDGTWEAKHVSFKQPERHSTGLKQASFAIWSPIRFPLQGAKPSKEEIVHQAM